MERGSVSRSTWPGRRRLRVTDSRSDRSGAWRWRRKAIRRGQILFNSHARREEGWRWPGARSYSRRPSLIRIASTLWFDLRGGVERDRVNISVQGERRRGSFPNAADVTERHDGQRDALHRSSQRLIRRGQREEQGLAGWRRRVRLPAGLSGAGVNGNEAAVRPVRRNGEKRDFLDLLPQLAGLDAVSQPVTRDAAFFHPIYRLRQAQTGVVEGEAIHDLVIVITGCPGWRAGKTVGVGSLEINDPSAVLIEERMLGGVIEIVAAVFGHAARVGPRAGGCVRFTEPNLAGFPGENHHPAPPVVVPEYRADSRFDGRARLHVEQRQPGLLPFEPALGNQLAQPILAQVSAA